MAFFDKLSKTVTEVSQKTIAKAKELADTSRLNSMISEEEKVIANQYFQIGKLYVSVHKDDFEDDFAGMIGAIAEAEAKIKDFKMQIQDIKGVQRCENCGAEVKKGMRFCTSCGKPTDAAKAAFAVPVTEPTIIVEHNEVCPNCGAKVEDGLAFCAECGIKLQ